MNFFKRTFPLLLVIFFCFACSQKPARIVNNSSNFYGKNNSFYQDKYSDVKNKVGKTAIDKSGKVVVASGETLYSISRNYRVPLRDLIEQNNLTPPYNLNAGKVLTIPSPKYHEVQAGETLSSVARLYKMNVDNIVALNKLESPYLLKTGQKLRISDSQNKNIASNVVVKEHPEEVKKDEVKDKELPVVVEKTYNPNFVEKTLDKFNKFSWPIRGKVVSKFGPKKGGLYNDGINISAPLGSKVAVSEDGVVAYVGNELKGYGNLVIVKHSGGFITAYAHLSKTLVKKGQRVNKLDKIAEVGSTGNVSSPQLYFGLRKGRDALNPENYLRKS
ncbi:MAG: M23 family metallopeptidase [Rickettsiales bacterium]|nr:M23 family metallopeptidase [Rickettsiales bacterium]